MRTYSYSVNFVNDNTTQALKGTIRAASEDQAWDRIVEKIEAKGGTVISLYITEIED
jgi:hypothetical protein